MAGSLVATNKWRIYNELELLGYAHESWNHSKELLLGLLDCVGVQATFFVLGWIAERLPGLIQRIRAAGHEIALHGYAHRRLTVMTRAEFEADLDRAIAAVSGVVPREALRGYRRHPPHGGRAQT